jgi:hypothetical protein
MKIKQIAKAPVNFVINHKVAFAFVAGVAATAVVVRTFNEGYAEAVDEFVASEGITEKFDAFMMEQ